MLARSVARLIDGMTLSRKILDRELARALPPLSTQGRVLDVGGATGTRYRHLLRATSYWSVDAGAQHRPNIVGDAHQLPIAPNSIDLVLSVQVLEHCREPRRVLEEAHRVLRPGGVLVLSTVLTYELHGSPYDYYRFTGEALADLARDFTNVSLVPMGNRFSAAYDLTFAKSVFLNTLFGRVAFALISRVDPGCPSGYILVARKGDA